MNLSKPCQEKLTINYYLVCCKSFTDVLIWAIVKADMYEIEALLSSIIIKIESVHQEWERTVINGVFIDFEIKIDGKVY